VNDISGGAFLGPSRDFQGQNPRSDLHWLYLAMVLFLELRLSPGWKPKIYWLGDDDALCTVSFLEAALFREHFLYFWVLSFGGG
jgi:hypothetical protein